MADLSDRSAEDPTDHERTGRALGWASGLALLVVPWVGAGVLATLFTMVGPESWDAETTFPWLLLVTFVAGLGWITYGCVRIGGFRRGAVPATAIALVVIAAVYLLTLVVQR